MKNKKNELITIIQKTNLDYKEAFNVYNKENTKNTTKTQQNKNNAGKSSN